MAILSLNQMIIQTSRRRAHISKIIQLFSEIAHKKFELNDDGVPIIPRKIAVLHDEWMHQDVINLYWKRMHEWAPLFAKFAWSRYETKRRVFDDEEFAEMVNRIDSYNLYGCIDAMFFRKGSKGRSVIFNLYLLTYLTTEDDSADLGCIKELFSNKYTTCDFFEAVPTRDVLTVAPLFATFFNVVDLSPVNWGPKKGAGELQDAIWTYLRRVLHFTLNRDYLNDCVEHTNAYRAVILSNIANSERFFQSNTDLSSSYHTELLQYQLTADANKSNHALVDVNSSEAEPKHPRLTEEMSLREAFGAIDNDHLSAGADSKHDSPSLYSPTSILERLQGLRHRQGSVLHVDENVKEEFNEHTQATASISFENWRRLFLDFVSPTEAAFMTLVLQVMLFIFIIFVTVQSDKNRFVCPENSTSKYNSLCYDQISNYTLQFGFNQTQNCLNSCEMWRYILEDVLNYFGSAIPDWTRLLISILIVEFTMLFVLRSSSEAYPVNISVWASEIKYLLYSEKNKSWPHWSSVLLHWSTFSFGMIDISVNYIGAVLLMFASVVLIYDCDEIGEVILNSLAIYFVLELDDMMTDSCKQSEQAEESIFLYLYLMRGLPLLSDDSMISSEKAQQRENYIVLVWSFLLVGTMVMSMYASFYPTWFTDFLDAFPNMG